MEVMDQKTLAQIREGEMLEQLEVAVLSLSFIK